MPLVRRLGALVRRRMLTARSQREGGAVIMITAFSMVVLVVATSFAIDIGRLSARRRDLQKTADVMSLDLLRAVGTSETASALVADATWLAAIQNSAVRNGDTGTTCAVSATSPSDTDSCTVPGSSLTLLVTVGQYSGTTFTPSSQSALGGNDLPGAVRVTAGDTVHYAFSTRSQKTSRLSIADRGQPEAWFKVGSFLATLDPNTNSILGQIVQSVIPGASVLSYGGIVSTSLQLSLLETQLSTTLGNPSDLLNTNASAAQILRASANALQAGCPTNTGPGCGGASATIGVLNTLAASASTTANLTLGQILGVQSGGTPASTANVNLGQLLLGTVIVANGTNAISVPNITTTIPGISSVSASLSLIQVPQLGGPYEGATATTQQMKLTITPTINVSSANSENVCSLPSGEQSLLNTLLGGVLGLLNCLLGPVLKTLTIGISGSVPITVTGAGATVSQHIDCTAKQLTLTPTELTAAKLQSAVNFNITLGSTTLAKVSFPSVAAGIASSASAQVFNATGSGPNYTTFSPSTSQFGSSPLGLKNLLSLDHGTVTILNTNLPVTFNLLQGFMMPLVNTALTALDQYVVTPLSQLLGLDLAGAQLWPLSMSCKPSTPALAQ